LTAGLRVGLLALQGAFREHAAAFMRLGATPVEVRKPEQLDALDALVMPGGESTTMTKLMDAYGFADAITAAHARGLPAWGTCAGAILIAREVDGPGRSARLGLIDMAVARNAYGRQVASFEAPVEIAGLDTPFRAVFIRAPRIESVGGDVDVLATYDGHPIMVQQGTALATVFHPELAGDDRVHAAFLKTVERATSRA
jgi:5'-phosphate synthase pdxT subunit